MKTIKRLTIGTFALALIVFNFVNADKNLPSQSTATLSNINALQASAGEWSCDFSNSNTCYLGPDGNVTGTGAATYRW